METPLRYLRGLVAKLNVLFGRGMVLSVSAVLLIALAVIVALYLFINSAAPNSITITSGPPNSLFQSYAEQYRKILAKQGVTLKVLPSNGSVENLQRLSNPKKDIDVGFVLGGEVNGNDISNLYSLGSVSYQPLLIFYRGSTKKLLADFKGLRLDIGPDGSGTHALALTLLKSNGIDPKDGTVLVDSVKGDPAQALLENRIDAIFVMGDSTSADLMRELLRTNGIQLFSFAQAEGYSRRINYLNKLDLPRGVIDFGKDIPAEDTHLIGPTVELVARRGLHPALSDLLIEAAQEVHGKAGILKTRGEFPVAQEHEFPLSPDALRYYKSGKTYLYRTFPFAIASLIARVLAVVVPVGLVLIPALRTVPAIYRWRVEYRINKWYRGLVDLERQAFEHWSDTEKRRELVGRLAQIEIAVSKISVPARYGSLFYGLREHISFVRSILHSQSPEIPLELDPSPENQGRREIA